MSDFSQQKVVQCSYPSWVSRSDCRYCSILHEVLFSALSDQELEQIIAGIYEPIDEFCYNAGSVLYAEGREDNAVYTIRSGLVKLVRYRPDGEERIIRLLKTADSTGLERLLDKPYGHTAIAIGEVHACRIPVGMLKQLDAEKPRFYRALMERWAEGQFQADDYIMLLLTGSAVERVVHLIQWLGVVTQRKNTNRLKLLSGKDMSAMLDLSTESISRIMADLKRKKIVWYNDQHDCHEYDAKAIQDYVVEHKRKVCA